MNHQEALQAGFTKTIPIIPHDAVLHEHSTIDPAMRGKVPGEYYRGAWDGMAGWRDFEMTMEQAIRYDALGANVGQLQGTHWVSLDVDITDETLASAMRAQILEMGGHQIPMRIGMPPKCLYLFKVHGDPIPAVQIPIHREGVEDRQLIEVLGLTPSGHPRQAVLFGTHPSGRQYTWDREMSAAVVPPVNEAGMATLVESLLMVAESRGWKRGKATRQGTGETSSLGAQAADPALVGEMVDLIPNDMLAYDDWVRVGYAIKAALGDAGWPVFARWSAKSAKDVPDVTLKMWGGFDPDGSIGFGTLTYLAKDACGGRLPGDLAERANMARTQALLASMPAPAATVPGVPMPGVPEQVQKELPKFVYSESGKLVANMANVTTYLDESEVWKGVFAFDTFANKPVIVRPIPGTKKGNREVEHSDVAATTTWFQRELMANVPKGTVEDGIKLSAHHNQIDPLRDYLNGVTWDGVPRIDTWLSTYGGVVRTGDVAHDKYTGQVGRKWLISAVARGLIPGCQADNALILEGTQGSGKSTMLRTLCPDPAWFGDSLPEFHTKDASSYISGHWIIEMAELTNVIKAEIEPMRAFLTRRFENYRPVYESFERSIQRRCVFAGTTNRDDYLKDPQGERRFWIVRVTTPIDIQGLEAVRDQLWAEAVVAFKNGENSVLDADVAQTALNEQLNRTPQDPLVDSMRIALAGQTDVSVSFVLSALQIPATDQKATGLQRRITAGLSILGYKRTGKLFSSGDQKGRSQWSIK